MNPTTLSLLLLLSVLLVSTSDSANDPPVKRCVPGHCGNITNITYPFLVSRQQPLYCGFPQFTLYCYGDILYLNTSAGEYYVHNISYVDHSILVSPRSLNPDCPVYRNLSFSPASFIVSPTSMYLLLLYHCQGPQIPDLYQVPCTESKIFTFLLSNYTASEPIEFFEACETVEIPVFGFLGANASDYDGLVKDGFLLEWIAADCSDCTASGGQCGYNVTKTTFMCICNDLTHSRHCYATRSNVKKIVIGVGIGGGILVMCFICCIWYCRRRIMRQPPNSLEFLIRTASCNVDQEMCSNNGRTHLFSYAELHEATNGFDESRELGDGGFGTAYKGQLRDGRVVSVKRLYENNYKRS